MVADLNLRDFPGDLLRWVKAQAAFSGVTMRGWVVRLVEREKRDAEARREKE